MHDRPSTRNAIKSIAVPWPLLSSFEFSAHWYTICVFYSILQFFACIIASRGLHRTVCRTIWFFCCCECVNFVQLQKLTQRRCRFRAINSVCKWCCCCNCLFIATEHNRANHFGRILCIRFEFYSRTHFLSSRFTARALFAARFMAAQFENAQNYLWQHFSLCNLLFLCAAVLVLVGMNYFRTEFIALQQIEFTTTPKEPYKR